MLPSDSSRPHSTASQALPVNTLPPLIAVDTSVTAFCTQPPSAGVFNPLPTCSQALGAAVKKAIESWDSDRLKQLLDEGAEVSQAGPAALKMAAQENELEQVEALIALLKLHGVDLNTIDPHGDTALTTAAREGHHQVVSLLSEAVMQAHGDLNAVNKFGFTPLAMAAYKGHTEAAAVLIKALVKAKGDLNAANEYGFTPLTRAAYMGRWEVVDLLATALHQTGGSVNVYTPQCGTALSLAIEANHLDAANRLLKNGAAASEEDLEDMARLLGAADLSTGREAAIISAREKQLEWVAQALSAEPAAL